ncbi:hypothetical protein [Nakamurella aerolata]|nr:hypothetical protein [Nakamurella aerolata]
MSRIYRTWPDMLGFDMLRLDMLGLDMLVIVSVELSGRSAWWR